MIDELRWNRETGKAENPTEQTDVDEYRRLIAAKDIVGLRQFYESRGEKWDNRTVIDCE